MHKEQGGQDRFARSEEEGREEEKEEEGPDQAGFSQGKAKTWLLFRERLKAISVLSKEETLSDLADVRIDHNEASMKQFREQPGMRGSQFPIELATFRPEFITHHHDRYQHLHPTWYI